MEKKQEPLPSTTEDKDDLKISIDCKSTQDIVSKKNELKVTFQHVDEIYKIFES